MTDGRFGPTTEDLEVRYWSHTCAIVKWVDLALSQRMPSLSTAENSFRPLLGVHVAVTVCCVARASATAGGVLVVVSGTAAGAVLATNTCCRARHGVATEA